MHRAYSSRLDWRIPRPQTTLLRVTYNGVSTPAELEELRTLDAEMSPRFLLYAAAYDVSPRPETAAQWLDALPMGTGADSCRRFAEGIRRPATADVAVRALELLLELAR